MKTIKTLILGLVAVTSFSFSTQAQPKKANENSLLWEISGNGLARPSYVYGTLHMMCESDFTIKEKVKKVLTIGTRCARLISRKVKNGKIIYGRIKGRS